MASHNHESFVLKPRDPSLTNSDDWPIFVLKDALVFDPIDPASEPCNLLHAGAYKPLSVSGKLQQLPKETSHLLLKESYHRAQPIEITNVRNFSYGQYEDGTVDIWADGQAGWYTINPSRTYKDVYADMVQAVRLLYYTADTYKEVKRRNADMDADGLFRKYCLDHPDVCSTPNDAEKLFARHRYFLFASMLDGKEGLQWARIPFFKYLESTFPDDAALVRQRRAFAMKPPKGPSSKRGTSSPAPSSASLKRKRMDRSGTPASIPARRSKSRSASIVTVTPSTKSTQSHTLASRPRRESLRLAQQHDGNPATKDSNGSDADSDDSSPGGRRGYKGKSALRPRPSKYVHNRRLAKGLPDGNDADDDETDEPHGAVQLSPSSKRKMVDDLKPRRAKRRNSSMPHDEVADVVTVSDPDTVMEEEEEEKEEEDDQEDEDGAEEEKRDTVGTPSEVYHDAKELIFPDKQPVLPFRFRDGKSGEDEGDVWRCTTDGCMHRVYAASEPASVTLIDDHRRTHEYDEDQRVRLVRRMQAPWLPVGRLMGRVRDLAAQSGTPPPVVQRY